MSKKDKMFWSQERQNHNAYLHYYNRLMEIAICRFEWIGLPETVDYRFLELTLFNDGKAVFFNDEDLGYLALRVATGGLMSVYNIPNYRRAYAACGYQNQKYGTNSVLIWNNLMHIPSTMDIEMYARRLYNYDNIIDTNVNAQKTPILIKCTENERITLVNMYQQYDGGVPVIFADKFGNTENGFTVLKTDAPYVADKIYQLKMDIWNEAMTFLGVANESVQKKERLIKDEVQQSQGGTLASRYPGLVARQQACDQINAMFNLNVSVKFREDIDTTMGGKDSETPDESEDKVNE